jgi:hypothetical protein
MYIATLVSQCLESLTEVANLETNDQYTADQIYDEYGRLRIWAGNVSAHTTGRESLYHRLRDSPELSSAVVKNLQDLLVAIGNISSLSNDDEDTFESHLDVTQTGHIGIGTDDGSYDDEGDDDLFEHVVFSSPRDGALEETRDIISCLYRLSMAIRNPARDDGYQHASTSVTKSCEVHDILEVSSTFPRLSTILSDRYVDHFNEISGTTLTMGRAVEPFR